MADNLFDSMIFFWVVLTIVTGALGSDRKIGGLGATLLSLFLSPLTGLIVTLQSKKIEDALHEKQILDSMINQENLLSDIKSLLISTHTELIDEDL